MRLAGNEAIAHDQPVELGISRSSSRTQPSQDLDQPGDSTPLAREDGLIEGRPNGGQGNIDIPHPSLRPRELDQEAPVQ